MSYKVNTPQNYNWEEQQYEKNDQPSQTIPDQTMSMREIIDRYANGGVIETFTPHYDDVDDPEEFLPDFSKMDLADRQEFAEKLQSELNYINQINNQNNIPEGNAVQGEEAPQS